MNPTPLEVTAIVLLIAAIIAIIVRFERFCLADIAQTDDRQFRYFTRQGWIALTIFVIPFGGVVYLLYGRDR